MFCIKIGQPKVAGKGTIQGFSPTVCQAVVRGVMTDRYSSHRSSATCFSLCSSTDVASTFTRESLILNESPAPPTECNSARVRDGNGKVTLCLLWRRVSERHLFLKVRQVATLKRVNRCSVFLHTNIRISKLKESFVPGLAEQCK